MGNFLSTLVGCVLANILYDNYFNKKVDEKVEKNFERRWFE